MNVLENTQHFIVGCFFMRIFVEKYVINNNQNYE